MTQLTENLYCIEVPESAKNVKISSLNNLYEYGDFGIKNILYELPIDDKFQVLGTVTKDEVSFDCEPYVESWNIKNVGKVYRCYKGREEFYTNKNDSYRSLIEHKTGKIFVNPIDKPPVYAETFKKHGNKNAENHIKQWQQAENNLLKKLVIIKKV